MLVATGVEIWVGIVTWVMNGLYLVKIVSAHSDRGERTTLRRLMANVLIRVCGFAQASSRTDKPLLNLVTNLLSIWF